MIGPRVGLALFCLPCLLVSPLFFLLFFRYRTWQRGLIHGVKKRGFIRPAQCETVYVVTGVQTFGYFVFSSGLNVAITYLKNIRKCAETDMLPEWRASKVCEKNVAHKQHEKGVTYVTSSHPSIYSPGRQTDRVPLLHSLENPSYRLVILLFPSISSSSNPSVKIRNVKSIFGSPHDLSIYLIFHLWIVAASLIGVVRGRNVPNHVRG